MAHFAKIENGVVREVIVIGNDDAPTEAAGQAFIGSIGLAAPASAAESTVSTQA